MSTLSCGIYFDIFKMAAILRSWETYSPEVIPDVEYASNIAMIFSDILSILGYFGT